MKDDRDPSFGLLGIRMSALSNKLIRQFYRWLSIAFILTLAVKFLNQDARENWDLGKFFTTAPGSLSFVLGFWPCCAFHTLPRGAAMGALRERAEERRLI